jgi:plasmid rolling circle replication initiator protein Rep
MHILFCFESLFFELLIFLFINNISLQNFEVKKYTVELKITFDPLFYIRKNYLKNE